MIPESADYDLLDFYIDEVKFAKIEKPDNKHEANIKSLHETLSDSLGEEFVFRCSSNATAITRR